MKEATQNRTKFREFMGWILWEIVAFGLAVIITAVYPMDPLLRLAEFLLCAIWFHVYIAWKELSSWKKSQKKLTGYLR